LDLNANRTLLVAALGRIPTGDREALQALYRLTSAKLFGVVLRILGERSEAEDVLQDVYLTVWRKAGTFDAARASPMTWLIAVARNRAIDRLRSGKIKSRMKPIGAGAEVADAAPDAERVLSDAQTAAKLDGCINGLAAHERVALRGAFFDGNTYEELAQRMTVPLGTMKSWIRRAMIKLKACLEQ
jgi:RNA polymerase sigma factor (sigma-70 family)